MLYNFLRMEVIYEKETEKKEDGEIIKIFEKCSKEEATHKQITYPETRREMGQERPGKRIKL